MATATVLTGRRHIFKNVRKNQQIVLAELDGAGEHGRIRKLSFSEKRKIGKAVAEVAADMTDVEQDELLEDCCSSGNGDGSAVELFKARVAEKLGQNAGDFIDIIGQLLPILLPLILACFGA